MNASQHDRTTLLTLARRETIQVEGPAGTTVRVTHGEVWATRHHDTRDYILAAGDLLEHDGRGKTLVTATQAARVEIHPPATDGAGRRSALRRLRPAGPWRLVVSGL